MADMNVASNQAGIFPKKLTPTHQEALDKIAGEGGNKKKIDTEAEVNKLGNYLNGGNLDKADKEILEKKIEEGKNTIYQNEVSKKARKEIENHLEKGQVKSYNDAKALADMLLDNNYGDLTKKHIRNLLQNSDYIEQLSKNPEYKDVLEPKKAEVEVKNTANRPQMGDLGNSEKTENVLDKKEVLDTTTNEPHVCPADTNENKPNETKTTSESQKSSQVSAKKKTNNTAKPKATKEAGKTTNTNKPIITIDNKFIPADHKIKMSSKEDVKGQNIGKNLAANINNFSKLKNAKLSEGVNVAKNSIENVNSKLEEVDSKTAWSAINICKLYSQNGDEVLKTLVNMKKDGVEVSMETIQKFMHNFYIQGDNMIKQVYGKESIPKDIKNIKEKYRVDVYDAKLHTENGTRPNSQYQDKWNNDFNEFYQVVNGLPMQFE